MIENLLFNKGNATEKCAFWNVFAPDHGVKEVNKSYLHMVSFSSLWPPSSLKDGWPHVRMHNSFLLTTIYVKRSLLTKSLTQILDFQLAALAPKNNPSVIYYVIQISWKIPFNELNELTYSWRPLSFNLTKKYIPFEVLLRMLVRNLRTPLGIYFRKVF